MIDRNAGPLLVAAAATSLFFALSASAASGRLSDCKCADLREIRDRWCSARAARSEYQRIERFLRAETARTGITRMYSLDDKRMINQVCVQEAINTTTDQDVVKASAVTNENLPPESLFKDECRIEVTSKSHTACLKQIVEAHEVFHSRECQKRVAIWQGMPIEEKLAQSVAQQLLGDTKYSLTTIQFVSEEAASYTREIVMINAKWKDLQKACPRSDFDVELLNQTSAGANFWNSITPDSSGRRMYKMYDPSVDPCPNRPSPSPSACTLR